MGGTYREWVAQGHKRHFENNREYVRTNGEVIKDLRLEWESVR